MSSIEENFTPGEAGSNGDGIVYINDDHLPLFVLEILGVDGDDSIPYDSSYLNITVVNKIISFN